MCFMLVPLVSIHCLLRRIDALENVQVCLLKLIILLLKLSLEALCAYQDAMKEDALIANRVLLFIHLALGVGEGCNLPRCFL